MIEKAPPPLWEQMCATATHSPVLAAMIERTRGPVLELGVGHNSTPFLHFMCQPNRQITSVDTDIRWIDFFKAGFNSSNHEYVCTNDDLISEAFFIRDEKRKNSTWDLAFVDHSPSTDRKTCIELLRNRAHFIVVHDSEPLALVYEWGDIFKSFKYMFYYDFYRNGTTVISDYAEIPLK